VLLELAGTFDLISNGRSASDVIVLQCAWTAASVRIAVSPREQHAPHRDGPHGGDRGRR